MSLGGKGSAIQETLHVDKELAKKYDCPKDRLYKVSYVNKGVAEGENANRKLEHPHNITDRSAGKTGATWNDVLLDAREDKIRPSKAYNIIKYENEIARKRAETEAFARELKLAKKASLLNADSTKFEEITELKDNSVDLIVTDPPYTEGNLDLFDALARLASKKLKLGGSLVFFYGQYQQPEVHEVFAKYKDQLAFCWTFCIHHAGAGY